MDQETAILPAYIVVVDKTSIATPDNNARPLAKRTYDPTSRRSVLGPLTLLDTKIEIPSDSIYAQRTVPSQQRVVPPVEALQRNVLLMEKSLDSVMLSGEESSIGGRTFNRESSSIDPPLIPLDSNPYPPVLSSSASPSPPAISTSNRPNTTRPRLSEVMNSRRSVTHQADPETSDSSPLHTLSPSLSTSSLLQTRTIPTSSQPPSVRASLSTGLDQDVPILQDASDSPPASATFTATFSQFETDSYIPYRPRQSQALDSASHPAPVSPAAQPQDTHAYIPPTHLLQNPPSSAKKNTYDRL